MNLALLLPSALVALAALALPILIHLTRRNEQRVTVFAALRWIDAQVRPRRRLRLRDLLLLALRLALLAVLALLLAHPVQRGDGAAGAQWIVLAPGIDVGAARAAIGPTDAGAQWRWLAPGFPPLTDPMPTAAPLASLLRELDAELPPSTRLGVVASATIDGLDGERPRLTRAIDWRVVPGDGARTEAPVPRLDLAIRAPPTHPALPFLRAAIGALDAQSPDCCTLELASAEAAWPDPSRTLLWLGAAPDAALLDWIERGGTAVVDATPIADGDGAWPDVAWSDVNGRVLARAQVHGRGRLIALEQALTPATQPLLLDARFPQSLRDWLAPGAAPTRGPATALAPRADTARDVGTPLPRNASTRPLDAMFALVAALLFALERLLAGRARSEA